VVVAGFGADMIAGLGFFVYLASIIFCAIIAIGYSEHSVRYLISGKATETAEGMCADSDYDRGFCYDQ
jgi:hypothetical protein